MKQHKKSVKTGTINKSRKAVLDYRGKEQI